MPRVAVGCSRFGQRPDEKESVRIVHAAIDMQMGFFDTADVYNDGQSERLLGEAIAGKRQHCVIATKFRHLQEAKGGSRRSIKLALEGSLRRLNTDYIDLYQLHAPDPTTPIEETIGALQDLVRRGQILYFGLCNVNAWQLVDAQRVAMSTSGQRLASVQMMMNAIDLSGYYEVKPVAERFRVGLLAAAPLARGLLGGSYSRSNKPPDGHPLRGTKGVGYWCEAGLAIAERVREMSDELGQPASQTALEVLLSFPEVTSVLVGVNSVDQLIDCAAARAGRLDPMIVRQLLNGSTVAKTDD